MCQFIIRHNILRSRLVQIKASGGVFNAQKSECESEEEKFALLAQQKPFPFSISCHQQRSGLMAQTAK